MKGGKATDEATKLEPLKHNCLAAAEMAEEENYNQIDGIINNAKKPSIIEHMRQFKPQPSERGDKLERPVERGR